MGRWLHPKLMFTSGFALPVSPIPVAEDVEFELEAGDLHI